MKVVTAGPEGASRKMPDMNSGRWVTVKIFNMVGGYWRLLNRFDII